MIRRLKDDYSDVLTPLEQLNFEIVHTFPFIQTVFSDLQYEEKACAFYKYAKPEAGLAKATPSVSLRTTQRLAEKDRKYP